MRQLVTRRLAPMLALGVAAAAAPAVLEWTIRDREVAWMGSLHFYAVGFSALAAGVAAAGLTVLGARRADTRTVLVGTAFAAMATLLALHGFATPGVVVGANGVVSLTGAATLPVGAVLLVLSALPLPRVLHSIVPLLVLQAVLLALIVALGASALAWPSLVPSVPAPRSPPALALLASGMAMYALLIVRALRTFLLTQRALDMAVVVGLAWLAVALVPALTMDFSYLAWWIGHEIELDGILLVGIAVGIDLARAAQSRPLAGDLGGADLVAGEDVFLGSHVRALTVRLAEKDEYTERHTRRVALRAVQVGEVLGLSRARLRELAIGALVHDIGKLSVPDAILKKPGALDDDEFAVIRRHPEWGAKLLAELGASPSGCASSCSTTTGGSTAPATRAGCAAATSTSTRASSPPATCTTPSARSASTATHGRTTRRWRCFGVRSVRRSTGAASTRSSGCWRARRGATSYAPTVSRLRRDAAVARLDADSSTFRSRTECGVTSTHSSSRMNSSACSSESGRGGISRTSSSADAARMFVSFFGFDAFTSRSSAREFSPTIMPS
jgi:hypothetical protein